MKSQKSIYKKYRRQRIKNIVLYILMAIGVFAIVFAVRVDSFIGASEILIRWWS